MKPCLLHQQSSDLRWHQLGQIAEITETTAGKPTLTSAKLFFFWASTFVAALVITVGVSADLVSETLATLLFAPIESFVKYKLKLRN